MLLKQDIRKQVREQINENGISKNISDAICQGILQLTEYKQAKTVFAFMPTKAEVDITKVLRTVLADGKTLCIPLCIENNQMLAKQIMSIDNLTKGKYGILQPLETSETITQKNIDFAILPSLATDVTGNRLGKGAGYYDRFLKDGFFTKIVVCPEFAVYDKIPAENHDIKYDVLVTENRVVNLK